MTAIGFNELLYILPFDHQGSFQTKMFGWTGTLSPSQTAEIASAKQVIVQLHHEPAVLVLTRQAVPTIDRAKYAAASGLARGAYILADFPGDTPEVILIGTGSEVALWLEAYEQLINDGIRARVVTAFLGIV